MSSLASTRCLSIATASESPLEGSAVSTQTQLSDPTDEILLTKIQTGNPEALSCLFERYARLVRTVSLRILKSGAEADDLVQDLFLFIQRKAGIFDCSKSSARSWIVQMAYQRAIERRRYLACRNFYAKAETEDRIGQLVGKPTIEDDYSPDAVFGRNGLEKVFAELSEDQRETLRLYFFEGYTLAEISEKLGQPVGNVRNHYYRALNKLRGRMFAANRPRGR